jgi:hypothetical protein
MLASALRVKFEEVRYLAFGFIGLNYVATGAPFANPVRMLKVTNLTNADLLISFNGIDDHDVIAARSAFIYDYGSNKIIPAGILEQPAGGIIYVKEYSSPAISGGVFVTVIYASTN